MNLACKAQVFGFQVGVVFGQTVAAVALVPADVHFAPLVHGESVAVLPQVPFHATAAKSDSIALPQSAFVPRHAAGLGEHAASSLQNEAFPAFGVAVQVH